MKSILIAILYLVFDTVYSDCRETLSVELCGVTLQHKILEYDTLCGRFMQGYLGVYSYHAWTIRKALAIMGDVGGQFSGLE